MYDNHLIVDQLQRVLILMHYFVISCSIGQRMVIDFHRVVGKLSRDHESTLITLALGQKGIGFNKPQWI